MKLTCLSKGSGYHSPPSHVLDLCGFRILLECPIDLSSLTIFSPLPLFSSSSPPNLITSLPYFKTLTNLHPFDPSLIHAVLISSPSSMLGLPFLTRSYGFSATIYVTEAAAKIGRMMMDELVSMHAELAHFYGPEDSAGLPSWMKWEELERLPAGVREVVMGEFGEELGSWMPLYSAADIKTCLQRVQTLKYAEEACFSGTLLLKAFSSGLEIGSCNWTINGPRRSITYLTSSIFHSDSATDFNYHSLCGNDFVLFSDFSSLSSIDDDGGCIGGSKNGRGMEEKCLLPSDDLSMRASDGNEGAMRNCLDDSDESLDEIDKINFICSCVVDSLNEGGSVLIPIGRLGIILLLLERISDLLESSNLKVPIFMVSPAAKEMLAFANVVPEWLCEQRQAKLFSGEALFRHVELMKERKLNLFMTLHSSELLMMWQEPCIVFSPHWSLRLGPVVHLLNRWHADSRCLLILEQGIDAEAALMPFEPVAIKVLQCSFLSGMKMDKIHPLLELLQPKLVLFPEDLKAQYSTTTNDNSRDDAPKFSFLYYSENDTLRVPNLRDNFEARMATDLAFQLRPKRLTLEHKDIAVARLRGARLQLSNGKYLLVQGKEKPMAKPAKVYWGRIDPARLMVALKEKGLNGTFVLPEDNGSASDDNGEGITTYTIRLDAQDAVISTCPTQTLICCPDETVAALICDAFDVVCEGI